MCKPFVSCRVALSIQNQNEGHDVFLVEEKTSHYTLGPRFIGKGPWETFYVYCVLAWLLVLLCFTVFSLLHSE